MKKSRYNTATRVFLNSRSIQSNTKTLYYSNNKLICIEQRFKNARVAVLYLLLFHFFLYRLLNDATLIVEVF
jgi:hypothetical protein